jgi:putative tricarboxylic transport membrane protein
MSDFQSLMNGFAACLTPFNLWMATLGCFLGTIVGILPGLGPVATMAILIPMTYGMDPTPAMILLTCIYYGSKYGGSTTSILVNLPGEAASVVTCFDGYQMARQGRAGAALGISAIGSFVGGILGSFGLIFAAVPLAKLSLKFGPAEFFSLIIMGMLTIIFVGGKSIKKSIMSGILGLALGTVGIDPVEGAPRFVYGITELRDGTSFVMVAMGLFGIGEVLISAEEHLKTKSLKVTFKDLWPSIGDIMESKWAILRGTVLGFFLGMLPGAGPTLASFMSYGLEKGIARDPTRFGKGAIEGVAGPETANNSATQGNMVPVIALGIPSSGGTALLLGALLMYGLKPGPLLFTTNPDFVWALLASMFIGNLILLIMNLPMVPLFASALRIPYHYLYPLILVICIIGAYSMNMNVFDVFVMLIFGVLGYVMKKFDIPGAPMVVALVLGPMLEYALYQALAVAHGDVTTFIRRPISGALLGITAVMAVAVGYKIVKMKRTVIEDEEG